MHDSSDVCAQQLRARSLRSTVVALNAARLEYVTFGPEAEILLNIAFRGVTNFEF
jgi:hypothetical protein